MNTPTRPKCLKVHKVGFRKSIKVMAQRGSDVQPEPIPAGAVLYARTEAAVSPQHLVEVANLYECDRDGNPTGLVYVGVPYSAFAFCEDEPGDPGL